MTPLDVVIRARVRRIDVEGIGTRPIDAHINADLERILGYGMPDRIL